MNESIVSDAASAKLGRGSGVLRTGQILANANEKNIVAGWDDAHRYSPAPRHRRRIILKLLRELEFSDCLDAGCAQPFLIEEIVRRYGVRGYGCDISDTVMTENAARFPNIQFRDLDLTRERWPADKQFDLVVSSEVLEHIPEWKRALTNLARMSRRHLLITVPAGRLRMMDRMVGHHQHFQGPELKQAIAECGFEVSRIFKWGFPVHALYKRLISLLPSERLYDQFSESRYGFFQKTVSQLLYAGFFLNSTLGGDQLFILARRLTPESREGHR
jgi:SAM-dependent methyltransferase